MEDPYPVENIDRLGVLMFQTSDNSQLLRSCESMQSWLCSQVWNIKTPNQSIFSTEKIPKIPLPSAPLAKFHSDERDEIKKKKVQKLLLIVFVNFSGRNFADSRAATVVFGKHNSAARSPVGQCCHLNFLFPKIQARLRSCRSSLLCRTWAAEFFSYSKANNSLLRD
jgi:hypothetical protein